MMVLQQPIEAIFQQLTAILQKLSKDDYTSSQPVLGNATIGQHTRHIIELFRELEAGYASGLVNYDNRKRDMLLETYPEQAIGSLQVFIETIARHDKPINILGSYSNDDEMLLTVHSSYYRELIYNLEHAIHHMAYIRIGIEHLGNILLPKDFGVAPATNRYRKACAQ